MRQAATGDKVLVHYTGTLPDGTVFDSSMERQPIEVTLGERQVIPGFEDAIVGMSEGETKGVTLEPDAAYGQHNAQLVHKVERQTIPEQIDLSVGSVLQAQDGTGNQVRLTVLDFDDDSVTLDANHPLAGQALTFELKLVGFGN